MPTEVENKKFATAALTIIQRFLGTQPDALTTMREQVATELRFAQDAVDRAQAQLDAIDDLQRVMEAEGDASEPANLVGGFITFKAANAPPLRKAILQVLTDLGELSRDDLVAELDRRGWGPGGKNPRNSVVSRLSDLTRAGAVEQDGGHYRITQDTEAAQQRLP
jgi:hypothetical protein